MAKKILFIESDGPFASRVSDRLEAAGFEVRVTAEGKEGIDLAREWGPAAVVLCVELPGMSGYLVCQKLKKDEQLKAIPLVLTSAEATQETFEKHRTLKARADDYLLKPYAPDALLAKLGALVGLPPPPAVEAAPEEELVSLEEEIGIDASAEGAPDQELPGLDLESLPDEPPAGGGDEGALDDDLKLLDDAFDGIAAPGAKDAAAALDELTGETPVPARDVEAAAASLPDEDEGAVADLRDLDVGADAALGALGGEDETLSPGLKLAPAQPAAAPRGATVDLLRAAGVKLLEDVSPPPAAAAPTPPPPPPFPPAAEARGADVRALERELEEARADLADRDAQLRTLTAKLGALEARAADAEGEAERARGKAEAAAAQLQRAEADARSARDEAQRATEQATAAQAEVAALEQRASDAEARATAAEQRGEAAARRAEAAEADAQRSKDEAAAASTAVARVDALERESDELRTELVVARGEAEGARGEVEKRTVELKKRVAEVEAAAQKNEERVVKAYQKIKGDEKVREKVRKALAIALQLLDEGIAGESAAEKERRAAAAGRE